MKESDRSRGRQGRGPRPQARHKSRLGSLFDYPDGLLDGPGFYGCSHRGEVVKVGQFEIMAGGTRDLRSPDLDKADLLVPLLHGHGPLGFGRRYQILAAPLQDYGGVPENWAEFLDVLIEELKSGKHVLVYCMGGHGRTGTLIASLIALLEPETQDPIAAARARHCDHAVETLAQAKGIFELRGQPVPQKYVLEFTRPLPGLAGGPELDPLLRPGGPLWDPKRQK